MCRKKGDKQLNAMEVIRAADRHFLKDGAGWVSYKGNPPAWVLL